MSQLFLYVCFSEKASAIRKYMDGKAKTCKKSPIISVLFASLFLPGRYYSERKEPLPLEVISGNRSQNLYLLCEDIREKSQNPNLLCENIRELHSYYTAEVALLPKMLMQTLEDTKGENGAPLGR